MRIDIKKDNGPNYYLHYDHFYVAGEESGYALTLDGYNQESTLPDDLSYNNGSRFSTEDRGNTYCAQESQGGWWFRECKNCYRPICYMGGHLNYVWEDPRLSGVGVPWVFRTGNMVDIVHFTFVEMKVRPKAWHCGNLRQPTKLQTYIAFLQRNYPNLLDEDEDEDLHVEEDSSGEGDSESLLQPFHN